MGPSETGQVTVAKVAIPVPLFTTFDYLVPEELLPLVVRGVRVVVPFGRRNLTGYVMDVGVEGVAQAGGADGGGKGGKGGKPSSGSSGKRSFKLKMVHDVLDTSPILTPQVLKLVEWIADYYHAPIGEVCKAALPGGINVEGEMKVRPFLVSEGELARFVERVEGVEPGRGQRLTRLYREGVGLCCGDEAALMFDGPVDGGGDGAEPRDGDDGRAPFDTASMKMGDLPSVRDLLVQASAGRGRGGRFTLEDLEALKDGGLIELELCVAAPQVSVKREEWVSWVPDRKSDWVKDQQGLGQIQLAVLAIVQEAGHMPMAMLNRRMTRNVKPAVNRLVARGLLSLETREVSRDPFEGVGAVGRVTPPVLTPEQTKIVDEVNSWLVKRPDEYQAYLLQGVTGSGKTEVYLSVIRTALDLGKQALVLVPEIALTPQLCGRFRARFGDQVALFHSGLAPGERFDQWRKAERGQVSIVVGARSALFAPLRNLGVIVVDEEHDGSFKQEESPRYNARDGALVRARQCGAVVVLGSATPSIESLYNSSVGKLKRRVMLNRATGVPMPRVEVVDMRTCMPRFDESDTPFSSRLAQALVETVESGKQAILFLNRRGFNTVVLCRACGESLSCPHCSVTLTHHQRSGSYRCHYCDYTVPFSVICPSCNEDGVGFLGMGTQKVEDAVRSLIPGVRVARMDRDSVGGRSPQELVDRMRDGDLDVLVGTQMVAKGHDFPGVVLVGVVMADMGLGIPDFRAGEKTFQLITQVAGRAGRVGGAGLVIIQTYNPDHYAVQTACNNDHQSFVERELEVRRVHGFPPYGHLVCIRVEDDDEGRARDTAAQVGRRLVQPLLAKGAPAGSVLGPAPAPIARLRGRYRWQILLQSDDRRVLRWLVDGLQQMIDAKVFPGSARIVVDVDPVSMM